MAFVTIKVADTTRAQLKVLAAVKGRKMWEEVERLVHADWLKVQPKTTK